MQREPVRPRALPFLTAGKWVAAAGALTAIAAVASLVAIAAIVGMTASAAVPPNLNKAIDTQRKLTVERPQDAAVWNDLGNLLVIARQPAEAEAAYRHAVELDPHRASALFNLGLLLQQQGNARESKQLFEQVVTAEPNHAWAHYQLGAYYEHKGEKSRAVKEYSQAFALDPQLAFREVNPQIVDNRLVTESLLRAYNRRSPAGDAPAIYDEPMRIRDLLVAQPKETEPKVADAAGQKPTVLRTGDLPPGNVGQASAPGGKAASGAPGRPGQPAGYPGAPGSPYTPPTSRQQWNRPTPTTPVVPNSNLDATQPGAVVTPPPATLYYRPSVPSTGQLGAQVMSERNG